MRNRWFDRLLDVVFDAVVMLSVIGAGYLFVHALGGDPAEGPGVMFMSGLLLLASAYLLRWRDDNARVVMGLAAGAGGLLIIWII